MQEILEKIFFLSMYNVYRLDMKNNNDILLNFNTE